MSAGSGTVSHADADMVKAAYARLARIYDLGFGWPLRRARKAAVAAVNELPGKAVLEVGVGTGLALPFYDRSKQVTGIDVSAPMLARARERVCRHQLFHVRALLDMDAQKTSFVDGQFDVAVAMFVASVVPAPKALLAELRRVVRPGGTILFINHFSRQSGAVGWAEKRFAPISAHIGWHANFRFDDMFSEKEQISAKKEPMRPLGLFQLVTLRN